MSLKKCLSAAFLLSAQTNCEIGDLLAEGRLLGAECVSRTRKTVLIGCHQAVSELAVRFYSS